ncbi:hypothetical protein [Streptomyces sp. NPDC057257]|uniref:DUF6197 family protein n=1 Tax=Streptomyces sp. NPDC057257 TaxID=3346071 RepID=UPI00362DCF3B
MATIISSAPRGALVAPTEVDSARRDTVVLELTRATNLPKAYRKAARLIARNGFHQGDLVPDPFDRELTSLHIERPMSIVAALRTAVNGNPHIVSPFSELAIRVLAGRLLVDGEGPFGGSRLALATHVDGWGDVEGRPVESVVAVLEAAADASEVSA